MYCSLYGLYPVASDIRRHHQSPAQLLIACDIGRPPARFP